MEVLRGGDWIFSIEEATSSCYIGEDFLDAARRFLYISNKQVGHLSSSSSTIESYAEDGSTFNSFAVHSNTFEDTDRFSWPTPSDCEVSTFEQNYYFNGLVEDVENLSLSIEVDMEEVDCANGTIFPACEGLIVVLANWVYR